MRTSDQIISELQTIEMELLKGIPDADISQMLIKQSKLVTYLASSASLVADAGYIYNKAKVKAYRDLAASQEANKQYYAPSLAKDFVSSQCGNECYAKDLSDRINSAVVHTLDAIRTAISAEGKLLQATLYSNTR